MVRFENWELLLCGSGAEYMCAAQSGEEEPAPTLPASQAVLGHRPPAQRAAPLCFYNVSAQDVLPAWVFLLTTGLLGFLPTRARSCLENTDPRMRGRGIQLLSQVLLQCYSLLQEKEGKGCSGPLSAAGRLGAKPVPLKCLSCCWQRVWFSTVTTLYLSRKSKAKEDTGRHAAAFLPTSPHNLGHSLNMPKPWAAAGAPGSVWVLHTQACSVPRGMSWGHICMSKSLGGDSVQENHHSQSKSRCSLVACPG